jgi:hypothetical protein
LNVSLPLPSNVPNTRSKSGWGAPQHGITLPVASNLLSAEFAALPRPTQCTAPHGSGSLLIWERGPATCKLYDERLKIQ